MPQTYFMGLDDEPEYERVEEFSGGMDAFTRPTLLPANVSRSLQNMRVDDAGRAITRPGADPVGGLVLDTGERVETILYYDTPSYERLFAAINGALLSWDGASWSTVGSYPFGANTILEMIQGANTVYVSDGVNQWRSYTPGGGWSGSLGNTSADPPVGATIMVWHTERMFASGVGSAPDTVYVSDIATGAGTGGWVGAANQIRVGRGEGQAIVDMVSLSGHYLVVGKESSIYLINSDPLLLPEVWEIPRIGTGVGPVSKHSMVAYSDRVFVFSADGVRKIIPSAASDTPFEMSLPISAPMQPYIDRINLEAKSTIRGWRYGHLLMWSVPLDSETSPNYTLVFNARTERWAGFWTGWLPTCWTTTLFSGVEQLVFGTSDGYVHQWKEKDEQDLPETFEDNGQNIVSAVSTRSMVFREPINKKDATWCQVAVTETAGTVNVDVYLDDDLSRTLTKNLEETANALPMDLPFNLATIKPQDIPMSLDELDEFTEAFVSVSCPAGKMVVQTITMAAFLNTRTDE